MKKTTRALLALPLAAVVAFGIAACGSSAPVSNSAPAASAAATASSLGYDKSDKPEENIAATTDKLEAWAESEEVLALVAAMEKTNELDYENSSDALNELDEIDKAWEGAAPYVDLDLSSEETRLAISQALSMNYDLTAPEASERMTKFVVINYLLMIHLPLTTDNADTVADALADGKTTDTKVLVEKSVVNKKLGELVATISTYTLDKDGYLASVVSVPAMFTPDGTRLSFSYLTKDSEGLQDARSNGAYETLTSDLKNAASQIETYLISLGDEPLEKEKLFASDVYKEIKLSEGATLDVTIVDPETHHYTLTGKHAEDKLNRELSYDSQAGFTNLESVEEKIEEDSFAAFANDTESLKLDEIFASLNGATVEFAELGVEHMMEDESVTDVAIDEQGKKVDFTYKGTAFKVKLAE